MKRKARCEVACTFYSNNNNSFSQKKMIFSAEEGSRDCQEILKRK